MRTIIRRIAIFTFILYVLPFIVPGFSIDGGVASHILGGAVLAFMYMVLRPILGIISFPINLLTLGLFSTVINGAILYFATIVIKQISVKPFTYDSLSYGGFTAPDLTFGVITAFIFTAFIISMLESVLSWIMK